MDNRISVSKLATYITKLKSGCSPGIDGIMSEHLKHSVNTPLVDHLSS